MPMPYWTRSRMNAAWFARRRPSMAWPDPLGSVCSGDPGACWMIGGGPLPSSPAQPWPGPRARTTTLAMRIGSTTAWYAMAGASPARAVMVSPLMKPAIARVLRTIPTVRARAGTRIMAMAPAARATPMMASAMPARLGRCRADATPRLAASQAITAATPRTPADVAGQVSVTRSTRPLSGPASRLSSTDHRLLASTTGGRRRGFAYRTGGTSCARRGGTTNPMARSTVERVMTAGPAAPTTVGRGRLPAVTATDVGLALAVGLVQAGAAYGAAHHHQPQHAWHPLAVALVAAGPAALLVRRRYPVAVLAVAYSAALAYWLAGYGRGPLFLTLIVAFVTAVMAGRRRAAIACLLAGFVGFLWVGPLFGQGRWPGWAGVLGLLAWLLVLFGAGEALRVRQLRAVERAQVRAAESGRAVSEERLRIARELHDVLAHNISLINVQAGTALHRAERNADRAYDALGVIKQVSQDTLVELRSLLGALREVDEAAPRAPAPTLARLEDLVASAAAAGVRSEEHT